MAKVLVTGGAGYIGSTTSAWLIDAGHEVWVLDDLSTGNRELLLGKGFFRSSCGDSDRLSGWLPGQNFDCVMHFAAHSLVSESVRKAESYYENNVVQTQKLLQSLLAAGLRNFVFSSSCAIFGDVGSSKIDEGLPKKPLSPYGENKWEIERYLEKLAQEQGLRALSLRYFNAAGAEPRLRVGEWHEPESHLIPKILRAASKGEVVEVYGRDYPTPDGTCIRDYIHVWDLAAAHCAAMERLLGLGLGSGSRGLFEAYNLGSEAGYSVQEVIQQCEEVIGNKIQVVDRERRAGDSPYLVADSRLAKKNLGFGKNLLDLKTILSSAWEWEKKRSRVLRPAIFVDRDGTINEDPGYLKSPEQLKLIDGAGEGLARLKKAGFLVVVISNQSGVGRGLILAENIPIIHNRMDELLKAWSIRIDHYGLCFHRPEDGCDCRKPEPKLILDAADALRIDVARSYMIGDKGSDLQAGNRAGCRASILVRTGEGAATAQKIRACEATFIADSLVAAADWILSQENEGYR